MKVDYLKSQPVAQKRTASPHSHGLLTQLSCGNATGDVLLTLFWALAFQGFILVCYAGERQSSTWFVELSTVRWVQLGVL